MSEMFYQIHKGLNDVLSNQYVSTFLTIVLTVYAAKASPKLPNYLKNLFNNTAFKILFIAFIAYRANGNPQLSILMALAFVVSMNFVSSSEKVEAFDQLEQLNDLERSDLKLETNGDIEDFEEMVLDEDEEVPEASEDNNSDDSDDSDDSDSDTDSDESDVSEDLE
jgi:hypothetical protein